MSSACAIVEQLVAEGIAARAHFQVWWTLRNVALPKFHSTMNQDAYVDFFFVSNSGHYKLFFLALSKIFDRDDRVAGVKELKSALRLENRIDLARYVHDELSPATGTVTKLMRIRNKAIVHNDRDYPRAKVYRVNGITPNQIRDVIDKVCAVINYVASELGHSNTIFEGPRFEEATLNMLSVLRRGQA
jgi:AbiU2